MRAICQPIFIRNPLLKIGSFALNRGQRYTCKLDLSKLAQRSFGTTQRYNFSSIQCNTARALSFYKISDIGIQGRRWRYTKIEAYKMIYRASDAILHQVISTAMLLTVQTMILTTKKVQCRAKSHQITFFC